MGSFFPYSASLSRQPRILNVRFLALLIFVGLHLQCYDCFIGHVPRVDSRHAVASHEAEAAVTYGLTTSPRRDLSVTSVARGVQNTKVHTRSNSNRTVPAIELKALLAFKAAISPDPLNALGSWTTGMATNDSDHTVCTKWVGVTCSPEFPNHVVALNLSNLQLGGALDSALPTLGHLPFLKSLDLSINFFTGSIQGEFLNNLSRLSYFNVSRNLVTGEIPSEMGELVSLQDFDVSQNNLTGLIPVALANCSFLRFIDVALNLLQGDIPASLGTLSDLFHLNASFNLLSGYVPGALGNCSSLLQLDLTSNIQIVGELPPEIGGLKQLQILAANDCYFSGIFPLWIANLTSLIRISLIHNQLNGEIPDTIGQLPYLNSFSAGKNLMSGVIPLSICNLTSLATLKIQTANFSGHIPSQIGALSSLTVLNLAENKFTGVIPSSLANCSTTITSLTLGFNELMDPEPIPPWIGSLTNLGTLYLTGMNLQGPLPERSFGMLSSLTTLTLAANNLTGALPISLRNCTYLYVLDVALNQLTGTIPSEFGELSYMYFFSVAVNLLTGPCPTFLSNWTQLYSIQLASNYLSGLIDGRVRIDQLGKLKFFILSANNFEGPIPETIGNSSSVNYLDLSFNEFNGTIPAWLGNMTNLQTLYLGTNKFHGKLPVDLLKSDFQLRISQLDLGYNELVGSIPFEIGLLSQLTLLTLDNNNFMGTLPSSLGNCSRMGILLLNNNQLQGNISAAQISRMSASLLTLDLSQNVFSGLWPMEFSALSNVQKINVSFNNISGSLPLGLGKCDNLQSLDISSNNLTGAIPQDLGLLRDLQFFNVSFNGFNGPIPHFNSSQINESSFLGNPGLCGAGAIIGLHEECVVIIPQNASTHRHCKDFNCKQVWITVAVCSFILVGAIILTITRLSSPWTDSGGRYNNSQLYVVLNFGTQVKVSERDVLNAIDDPSGENVIGRGARSIVYRGVLPGGEIFALKKLVPNSYHNQHIDCETEGATDNILNSEQNSDLLKEAEILAKLKHKNIVKYLSFYSGMEHRALILEYVSGGSLHKHLHELEPCKLTWQTRLKIAMGVAEGMKYLHHDFPEPLIHRDMKPSNVLLNDNFESKVADFGISKFVDARKEGEASASSFCGTIGYIPPEYASQPWVSTKGDVYSYGMVLIELLTRRQPCSTSAFDDQGRDLRNWVSNNFNERPFELLDPLLIEECSRDNIPMEQAMLLLRVGLFCTRVEPQSRPSMMDVVGMLALIINLGAEPVIRRTTEEIANDIDRNQWTIEDPSIEGAEFSSSG